jgi:hypothetical protein
MVDTGSTYNICSLKFFTDNVQEQNPFETPDPNAPELVLGDGKTMVQILGRIHISLQFTSKDHVQFITRHPFCIINHDVPHGIILGHTFFQSNAGFDISYEQQCIKLSSHYVPWQPQKNNTPELPTISAYCNGQNTIIKGRALTFIQAQVTDAFSKPLCNQYGLITNNEQHTKTLECMELPETCIGFTDEKGYLKIPVTNHGFQDLTIGAQFATFTPEDPLQYQYYNYNSMQETFELNNINTNGTTTITKPEYSIPTTNNDETKIHNNHINQTEGPVFEKTNADSGTSDNNQVKRKIANISSFHTTLAQMFTLTKKPKTETDSQIFTPKSNSPRESEPDLIDSQKIDPPESEPDLTDSQKIELQSLKHRNPLFTQKIALEIIKQTQADISKVPNYFDGDQLSDELLPSFLRGYRVDLSKMEVDKAQICLFIYECCVLPPGREKLFSPDNIPGRLKDFEVTTKHMRFTSLEPWSTRLRSMSPNDKLLISEICDKHKKLGLIENSHSEYTAPVILIRKPNGRHQIACCLIELNKRVIKDCYPLPLLQDNLNSLANTAFLSSIDICGAYLSVGIEEKCRDYFSFITHCGLYRWKVLP